MDHAEATDNQKFRVMAGGELHSDALVYRDAMALVNEICDEWKAEGWTVDRSWASSGNYYAALATKVFEGARAVAIELDEEPDEEVEEAIDKTALEHAIERASAALNEVLNLTTALGCESPALRGLTADWHIAAFKVLTNLK